MYKAIGEADKSILLEMYIFEDDMEEYNFIQALIVKSKQGVKVKLVLDAFGSLGLSSKNTNLLRSSGVEVLFFSHLLHRIHRKILIIDEKIGFMGGANLHQSAKFWKDLVLRLEGKIVHSLLKSFAKVYGDCGGKDKEVLVYLNKKIFFNNTHSFLVEHFPYKKKFELKKLYRKHLRGAKESIDLVTPYFMPKRWLMASLHQAVLRGVNITIIVPRKTDNFLIDRVNYFYMRRAQKLGIKLLLTPKMNHAKAMLIDKKEALIGSQNLDFLSFEFNAEAGIFSHEPDTVNKLNEIIERWKGESESFDLNSRRLKWFDYLLSPLINLFSKII